MNRTQRSKALGRGLDELLPMFAPRASRQEKNTAREEWRDEKLAQEVQALERIATALETLASK